MRCIMRHGDRSYGGLLSLRHVAGIGRPVAIGDFKPTHLEDWVGQQLLGFLRRHVCIGAKALAQRADGRELSAQTADEVRYSEADGLYYAVYPDMTSVASAVLFLTDLEEYYAVSDAGDPVFKSFVAVFPEERVRTQEEFEIQYWRFAQLLSDISLLTHPWPDAIPSDPAERHFELCLAGRPVFSTTLNPQNPRLARQFSYLAWVMNQKSQFDMLRARETFERWQRNIRADDAKVDPSGQPNPILVDHGDGSAAMQLAGSFRGHCDFHVRSGSGRVAAGERLLQLANVESAPDDVLRLLKSRYPACSKGGADT